MRFIIALIACSSGMATASHGAIELRGFFTVGTESSFALVDPDSGAHKWVKSGDKFGAFTVGGLDRQHNSLTLHGPGQDMHIPLSEAVIKSEPAAPENRGPYSAVSHLRTEPS